MNFTRKNPVIYVLSGKAGNGKNKIAELKTNLSNNIRDFKRDHSHTKSPASLKYLRKRITASINIFRNCLV